MFKTMKPFLIVGWLLPLGLFIGLQMNTNDPAVPEPVETAEVAEVVEPTPPAALSAVERQAFRDEVRTYLLDSPEVLMEAIAVLEARQQQDQIASELTLISDNSEEIFEDGYSWEGGNPDGDITMVEFLDYRCGYCRRAHDQVAELIESDGNIRLIVKEFPILGEQSLISARLAIAALQTVGADDYRRLNNALMTFNGDLTDATIRNLLTGMNIDADPVMARIDNEEVTLHIANVNALAQKLKITGTPTFVIQQELVRGYVPLEDMRNMIAVLREQSN